MILLNPGKPEGPYGDKRSTEVMALSLQPSSTDSQIEACQKMLRTAIADPERYARVWEQHVEPLDGAYVIACSRASQSLVAAFEPGVEAGRSLVSKRFHAFARIRMVV